MVSNWIDMPRFSPPDFAITFDRKHRFKADTLKAGLTVLFGGCMEVDTVATGKYWQWKARAIPNKHDPLGQRLTIKLTTHKDGKSRVTVTPADESICSVIRAWKDSK